MQQQLRALDVPQKAIAKPAALVRSFNQARYIGNDKRAEIASINDAQMRLERGERIVGDLWSGC